MRIITHATLDMETMQWVSVESYEYEGPLALCDRSLQKTAQQGATTASTTGGNYGAAAGQIGGNIVPFLEGQVNNPTGFSSTDMNNMLVANQQGAGGATSGITGQANLQAARTRNAGGFTSALDQAARDRTMAQSQGALQVQNENANLKQKKQMEASQQLGGLYGTDVSAQLRAMGLLPEDVNAGANAGRSGWLQDTTGILGALKAPSGSKGLGGSGFL